ncbi:MAG: pentapeptide repeat-containing protein [Elainellaceae cyanobacterium]
MYANTLIHADLSMDAAQLLHRYAEGQRDFSWADLRRTDLRGASLTDINFYRADLTGALLDGANLRRTNFLKANLTKANLSNADLTGAILKRTDLTGTILTGAVLDAVQFSDMTLPGGLPTISAAARRQSSEVQAQAAFQRGSLTNPTQANPSRSPRSPTSLRNPSSQRSMRHLASLSRPQSPPITDIPLPSLILLWAGYCCFGSILGIFDVSVVLWVMVWATALTWMLGESMAWFIPILAAIAVMLGSGLSLWSVFMAGSVSLGLMAGLLLLNWSVPKALKDSLWIGGIVAVLINLGLWLVKGEQGRVVLSGYFPLVFLLLIGMGSSGMGAIAWLQMRSDGFHKNQIAWIFGGFAALGLFSGGAMSSLIMPSL